MYECPKCREMSMRPMKYQFDTAKRGTAMLCEKCNFTCRAWIVVLSDKNEAEDEETKDVD